MKKLVLVIFIILMLAVPCYADDRLLTDKDLEGKTRQLICMNKGAKFIVQNRPSMTSELDRLLTDKDLEGKTLQDIYLMRNEIFARHSRPFKTSELDRYFRSQEWYKVDVNYDDSMLTETDAANINALLAREQQLLKRNYVTENGETRASFGNVVNGWQFGQFSPEEIDRLEKNGFLVVPAKYDQFFHLYDNNMYRNIASFITTDSVMQLYHMLFDYTLRELEEQKLYPKLEFLCNRMFVLNKQLADSTTSEKIRKSAERNMAYFAVAVSLLDGSMPELPPELAQAVEQELDWCNGHKGLGNSPIFTLYEDPELDHVFDYSQYVPRGHYTRSEKLKNYFMAMMWLGNSYFSTSYNGDLTQSCIITHQLFSEKDKYNDNPLIDTWDTIYEPTVFYVGLSDDIGPREFKKVMDEVFGPTPDIAKFTDKNYLAKVRELAKKLPEPQIMTVLDGQGPYPHFRFMGQRYIPDSETFQRLTEILIRYFPRGLDVTASLGSGLSRKILLEEYKEGEKWDDYVPRLDKMTDKFSKLSRDEWTQNLYYSWLWSLKSVIELEDEHEYPFFMRTEGWGRKSLCSTLASWSELRHDTILYAKQSYMAVECGGEDEEIIIWTPDPPKGYVEPNVEFYTRLGDLLELTRDGLKSRGISTRGIEAKTGRMMELVEFLRKVSEKELRGEPLTTKEYEQIEIFGSLLESLTISVMDDSAAQWWEISSDVDKNVAVIADVHTGLRNDELKVLEVGTGPAYEIYVIVEVDGHLKLTRGAVFSYFEFEHPAGDRLTDEKWQEMLKNGTNPPMPDWTKMFLSPSESHDVPNFPEFFKIYIYNSGC